MKTPPSLSIILLGSTGLIGSEILKELQKTERVSKILCPVRKIPKMSPSPRVEFLEVDFENTESLQKLFQTKFSAVISALGTTIKKAGSEENFKKVDYEYPLAFAKLAKEHFVKQYSIVTAMGSDAKSWVFYNRVKGEVEDSIIDLGIDRVSIFRPSLLLGDRNEFRIGEKIGEAVTKLIPFSLLGLQKYEPIQASKVASAIVKDLLTNIDSPITESHADNHAGLVAIWENDAIQSL